MIQTTVHTADEMELIMLIFFPVILFSLPIIPLFSEMKPGKVYFLFQIAIIIIIENGNVKHQYSSRAVA